ncbi:MAG: hypothetical protein ACK5YW_07440 [Betaproteobacteria bacterium]|jgi:hypothetical protein|nr:hypothetical protein [Rhodocyclaceae bacterium]
MQRRTLCTGAVATALAWLAGGGTPALAHTAPDTPRDATAVLAVEIIDRDTGRRLPIYLHEGRHYVACNPGARYAVVVRNCTALRVLAVVSVDGVNAVSGETAAWYQTGYVLGPFQHDEVRGWRKSLARIAAFEFTALPDACAARTSRPGDVGVIGVALFREAPPPEMTPLAPSAPESSRRSNESSVQASSAPPSASKSGGAARRGDGALSEGFAPRRPQERLGTGHGRGESSQVGYTDFERASPQPDKIITIYYDSRANLMTLGVIPRPARERPAPEPDPFPGSVGFVPDPPR